MPRAGALCKIGRTTRAFIAEASTERGGRAHQEAVENWLKVKLVERQDRGGGINYSIGSLASCMGFTFQISTTLRTHARTGPDTQRAQAHNHTQKQDTKATQTHLTFTRTRTQLPPHSLRLSHPHARARSAPARGTIACAMHRGWAKPETHGFQ